MNTQASLCTSDAMQREPLFYVFLAWALLNVGAKGCFEDEPPAQADPSNGTGGQPPETTNGGSGGAFEGSGGAPQQAGGGVGGEEIASSGGSSNGGGGGTPGGALCGPIILPPTTGNSWDDVDYGYEALAIDAFGNFVVQGFHYPNDVRMTEVRRLVGSTVAWTAEGRALLGLRSNGEIACRSNMDKVTAFYQDIETYSVNGVLLETTSADPLTVAIASTDVGFVEYTQDGAPKTYGHFTVRDHAGDVVSTLSAPMDLSSLCSNQADPSEYWFGGVAYANTSGANVLVRWGLTCVGEQSPPVAFLPSFGGVCRFPSGECEMDTAVDVSDVFEDGVDETGALYRVVHIAPERFLQKIDSAGVAVWEQKLPSAFSMGSLQITLDEGTGVGIVVSAQRSSVQPFALSSGALEPTWSPPATTPGNGNPPLLGNRNVAHAGRLYTLNHQNTPTIWGGVTIPAGRFFIAAFDAATGEQLDDANCPASP